MRVTVFTRIIFALGLLAMGSHARAQSAQRPQILVVLSYHVGMLWEDEITRGLVEQLADKNDLIITQLDVQRFSSFGREQRMLEILTNRIKISRPVLVITVDDFAYRYVLEHRNELEPGTPIVFGGVNYWDGQRQPGVTGVVEAIDLASTLNLMEQLQPNARRWVIVNDRSQTGLANRKTFDLVKPIGSPHDILWLGDGTFAETEARLAKLDPAKDAVLLLTWNVDASGLTRSYESTIKSARAACRAPLYGVWDFYFGSGIVGGSLLDGRVHGREMGDLANRILAGENPDLIPVVTQCETRKKVDFREIQRFSLPAQRIPDDFEIAFKKQSAWEQYANAIIAIGVVIALQAATITWLIIVIQRRRQARAKLHESEANLRHTLDSIEEAVIVTDTQNKVERINPAAEKLAGLTNLEALGLPLHDVLPLQDLRTGEPLTLPTLPALRQKNEKQLTPRARLKSRAGVENVVVHSAAPILDEHGEERGMVMVLRNVTEQHKLEEQLYQSQKMESIGQLAGGIAHDFNNILAVIVGHGELLREQLQKQPTALEDLQMLLRGAQRATDLVQQILAFSRKSKHEMTPSLLQPVVKETLKFLRSTVPSSIEIAPRISTDLPLVLADVTQIHQILMNLCANAAHAMKGMNSGRLEVRLESVHADSEFALLHPGLREGEYVRLSVSDTGHGMDEQTLKRIFEPFFTTKSQGEGTGLGLSVVHGIVKAHNGGIYVYSQPGEGTIFHIYLPALSISRGKSATAPIEIPTGRGENILFVDDELAICTAAKRMIENLGYKVSVFNKPLLAMEELRRNSTVFDLVITDLTMPSSNGLTLADEAHAIRPDVPVILTTGFAADLTDEQLRARGISRLVLKPFATPNLAQAIDGALHRRV
ncbi:MAG: ATP-binding protein [Nibricoccus sp.]